MSAFIKARRKGAKQFAFVTPTGGLNKLRIHASIFADAAAAQRVIDNIAPDNPDYEWRVTN